MAKRKRAKRRAKRTPHRFGVLSVTDGARIINGGVVKGGKDMRPASESAWEGY